MSDVGGIEIGAFSLDDLCLSGSRVTVFREQNCHGLCLVFSSDKATVHQDFRICIFVFENSAVRRVVARPGRTLNAPRTEWQKGRFMFDSLIRGWFTRGTGHCVQEEFPALARRFVSRPPHSRLWPRKTLCTRRDPHPQDINSLSSHERRFPSSLKILDFTTLCLECYSVSSWGQL